MYNFGVRIKKYHADNIKIYEKPIRDAVEESNQTINFWGVEYHHQNAISKLKIKTLTLGTRKLLLHAKCYWLDLFTTMLWFYVLTALAERVNNLKVVNYEFISMETFVGNTIYITLKYQHTWKISFYLLYSRIQNENTPCLPKWYLHSFAWIFLLHSHFHSSLVTLILNPSTRHVSPQYHVVFDDNF